MKSFNSFLTQPIGEGKVFLPTLEQTFVVDSNLSVHFSILLNRRGIIDEFRYELLGEGEHSSTKALLSCYTDRIEGLGIDELWLISQEEIQDIYNVPKKGFLCFSLLIRQMVKDYSFGSKRFVSLGKQGLVCRCFGISSDELFKLFIDGKIQNVLDVTNETMAGGGCTSCLGDIESLIDSYKSNLGVQLENEFDNCLNSEGGAFLIKGEPQVYWVRRIHDFLTENSYELEIVDLRGFELTLHGEFDSKKLQDQLKEQFDVTFVPLSL